MVPTPPPPRADGKLEIAITDLEMTERPIRNNRVSLTGHTLEVGRAMRPTLHFYRYLYETVGTPYLWFARSLLSDEALAEIIHDDRVEVLILYVDGSPVGFAELDRRGKGQGKGQGSTDDIDITHFGVVPEHLGQGLGLRFLDRVVDQAWNEDPARLIVHVASFDHPRALMVYQRAGFVPYDKRTVVVDDPRSA